MSARHCSASKRSITTTVPPRRCTVVDQPAGAAWYSGAGLRYTESSPQRYRPPTSMLNDVGAPRGVPTLGGLMPLGFPVVPDE